MDEYKTLSHSLYHIDIDNDKIESDNLEKGKAEEYVQGVINKSLYAKNVRYYRITRPTTEVISLINDLIKGLILNEDAEVAATSEQGKEIDKIDLISEPIAKRLLIEERKSQEKILKMKREIRKGSLIQAVIQDQEKHLSYILAKVEHVNILDRADWEEHTGLPLEKEILKTCVINYGENGENGDIKIFDSNNTISKYWSEGLLELEPFTTNEDNTKKSFKEIDRILYNNIKKKSPADYNLLVNSLIGYYNQNKKFDFDELKEKVFVNYSPQNPNSIEMDKIINKVETSISKERFDKQFEIIPEVIRKNKIRTYKIHEDIDLTIKDNIENLRDVIKANKTPDEIYLKIKIDEKTFNEFNYKLE